MQALYVDTGNGPVDFTKFVLAWETIDIKKNEPWLFDFSVVFVPGVAGWSEIKRGAYVRFEDSRWESRSPGVPDGVLFTGYVTEDPEYTLLGQRDQQPVYGYKVRCSSDDYLINSKKVPVRTFINKSRGYILRTLLFEMFGATIKGGTVSFDAKPGSPGFPFNVTNILAGGVERIYQTDPKKLWTEVAMEFAKADGYVYWALDKHLFYVPESLSPPTGSDPRLLVVLDEKDPRYNPDQIAIRQVSNEVANDITVFGLNEPTTICREEFVSDGYQGEHSLSFLPFGVEEGKILSDDFTGSSIDESVWEERDELTNYIQPFEGALNVVGGPGFDTGRAFLRSLKGVELTGVVSFRDGEIYFPPDATGAGIIGGLFTEDDCRLANLVSGWHIDLNAPGVYVRDASGIRNGLTLNKSFHYILRRQFFSAAFVTAPPATRDPETGKTYTPPAVAQTGLMTYHVEIINATDPANVVKTFVDMGTYLIVNPEFALYAPIVPFDCHLVMNHVEVSKPSQVYVTVDGQVQRVGSYLDGGRCSIIPDGNRAKLAWYSVMGTSVALNEGERSSSDVTTIPARGARIAVSYRQSDKARARLQSTASITDERKRFHDDGIRQLVLGAEEVTPSPRTSEECLLVCQAAIADRQRAQWEGSFDFITQSKHETELVRFIMPGDRIPLRLDTPEGTELDTVLDVTGVSCTPVGKDTWLFSVSVGPINRFEQAERELYRRRRSSLDEIVITPSEIQNAEILSRDGYDWVPDPADPKVGVISDATIRIDLHPNGGGAMPVGVHGFEVRDTDSGWGQPNFLFRVTTPFVNLTRDRRDRAVFVRSYRTNTDGSRVYSRRSALVRVVIPRKNTTVVSGIDGEIFAFEVTFFLPLPKDQDFAGVHVWGPEDILLYQGDGLQHIFAASGLSNASTVLAWIENSRIVLQVTMSNPTYLTTNRSYPIKIRTVNLLGEYGPETAFTATRVAPSLSRPPTQNSIDPTVWSWEGEAKNWRVNIFDENDNLESQYELPGDVTEINTGRPGRRTRVEVEAGDEYGYDDSGSGTNEEDTGVPGTPLIQARVLEYIPGGVMHDYIRVTWEPTSNFASAICWHLEHGPDPAFPAFTVGQEYNRLGAGQRQIDILSKGETKYVRIRAENSFGLGPWSLVVNGTTGEPLDAVAYNFEFDPNDLILNPNWRTGSPTAFKLPSVNDGTNRALVGIQSSGRLALDLPAGIGQLNSLGGLWPIIRGDNDVRALTSGSSIWDGSFRSLSALNASNYLQTGLVTSSIHDGVSWRSIINNNHDVRAMASGASVWDGSFRALGGLDSNSNLVGDITYGVLSYNSAGGGYLLFRRNDPHSTMDDFFHGDTYFRTTFNERNGGGYGYLGFDVNGYVKNGITNRFNSGYISTEDIDYRCYIAYVAIDTDGSRIDDLKVDRWSIVNDGVVGIIIEEDYALANNLRRDGSGFDRYYV